MSKQNRTHYTYQHDADWAIMAVVGEKPYSFEIELQYEDNSVALGTVSFDNMVNGELTTKHAEIATRKLIIDFCSRLVEMGASLHFPEIEPEYEDEE
jgi:hypothetical protein